MKNDSLNGFSINNLKQLPLASRWMCIGSLRIKMYSYIILPTIILCAIHIILIGIYIYLKWHHNYWHKRGVVTAKPLTIVGSYTSIFRRKTNLLEEIQNIYDDYKIDNRAVGVFLARQPKLLILEPTLAHEILVKKFSCFRDNVTSSFNTHLPPTEDKYVRLNPFWSGGEHWKCQRILGQGGLTLHRIKQAYGIWQSAGTQLKLFIATKLKDMEDGGQIEIRDLTLRFTAHVMCDFIWGLNVGALNIEQFESSKPCSFVQVASKWATHAFSRKERFFATLIAPFVRKLFCMRNFPEDTDAFFKQLTKDALELRTQTATADTRNDYLNYLLHLVKQKSHLKLDDLVGLALTILIDGYDTTGDALMRTLYYLAKYPKIQSKLRSEIFEVNNIGHLDYERLNSLPYLEQCIYESLRIGSLVEQYTRICTKPTKLDIGKEHLIDIEPGTFVMVPIYQLHRDERFYSEPSEYKPERFDNDILADYIKCGLLLPFGDGPRLCMGRRIALLTLKTALVNILTHHELLLTQQKLAKNNKGFELFVGDIWLEFKPLNA